MFASPVGGRSFPARIAEWPSILPDEPSGVSRFAGRAIPGFASLPSLRDPAPSLSLTRLRRGLTPLSGQALRRSPAHLPRAVRLRRRLAILDLIHPPLWVLPSG